jgi:hypothetical protein
MHYVDVGTSGGVWGLERGYCLMIGGEPQVVKRLDPIFARLAPGAGDIARTPGREQADGTSEQGYLHCGPNGAGHFVKMVHNGIEYGIMAAYARAGILSAANVGKRGGCGRRGDHPLRDPEHWYDLACGIARCGGVAASSPRGCSPVAAALARTRRSRASRGACPTPARALDDQGGHRRGYRPTSLLGPLRAFARVVKRTSPTSCSTMRYEFSGPRKPAALAPGIRRPILWRHRRPGPKKIFRPFRRCSSAYLTVR